MLTLVVAATVTYLLTPVARRIALGESPYRDLKSVEAFRALKGLEHAGVVGPAGPRRWRILEPLLARYLRELEPFG